jgi:hypothetical protein
MMKTITLLILACLVLKSAIVAQDKGFPPDPVCTCLPDGITFTTQAQIDSFQVNYPGCTEIEGDVAIQGSSITNLNGLNMVASIVGDLDIWVNNALTNLTGLENLASIGGSLLIYENSVLTSLMGLENLATIGGGLTIESNNALTSMTGLENLTIIEGSLFIGTCEDGNMSLTSLTGLGNLTSIGGGFHILNNSALTSLMGLENLASIGGSLRIGFHCYGGGGNPSLASLMGMENLDSIGGVLYIIDNNSLSTCDDEWLCDYLTAPTGAVNISGNAPGCSSIIEVAYACGGLPCLPYGNYKFGSQSDVDLFAQAFPGCTELEGDVIISVSDITNLNGLNMLTSIGGRFSFSQNHALTSLTGLENLISIGGSLWISDNHALTSLTGLGNLTYIGGILTIGGSYSWWGNPQLTSLEGLNNIAANSITNLYIQNNSSLSNCEVQSICEYLVAPNGTVIISNNAPGCNSLAQVEEACEALGIEESTFEAANNGLIISPNPFTNQTTLEFTLQQGGPVQLAIYNQMGELVALPVDEYKPAGEYKISWNAAGLPAGVYYCRLQAGNQIYSGKMILMK